LDLKKKMREENKAGQVLIAGLIRAKIGGWLNGHLDKNRT